MKYLRKSIENSPVIMKGDYPYFINPLTDGIPQIEPEILMDAVYEIKNVISENFTKILTVEAMGLPIGVALSLELNKPMTVVRKRAYGLPGELEVLQKTGYSESRLYINSVKKEDSLLIVDDVLSTGGTMIAIVNGLKRIGARIEDIVVVVNKNRNIEEIEKKIGHRIKAIVNIEIVDGKVRVID